MHCNYSTGWIFDLARKYSIIILILTLVLDCRPTGYSYTISKSDGSCFDMQSHSFSFAHFTSFQYVPHFDVHNLCVKDEKNSGKFQRNKIDRFHDVFDVSFMVIIW